MAITEKTRILMRRRNSAEWEAFNEVLMDGEIGVVSNSKPRKFKIGTGVDFWRDLPYAVDIDSLSAGVANVTPDSASTLPTITTVNVSIVGTYVNFGSIAVTQEDLNSGQVQLRLENNQWKKVIMTSFESYVKYKELDDNSIVRKKQFNGEGINLANPENIVKGYEAGNINIGGQVVPNPNRQYVQIDGVNENAVISIYTPDLKNSGLRINCYDVAGNFLADSFDDLTGKTTVTTKPGTYSLKISWNRIFDAFVNRILVQYGEFTSYDDYRLFELAQIKDVNNGLKSKTVKQNMFVSGGQRILGVFIGSNGAVNNNLDTSKYSTHLFYTADLPEVNGTRVMNLDGILPNIITNDPTTEQAFITIRFEDINSNYLGHYTNAKTTRFPTKDQFPMAFTLPENTHHWYISTMADSFDRSAYFNLIQGNDIVEYYSESSKLVDKFGLFVGDSVVYANLYQRLVSDRLKFRYANLAIQGACITPGHEDGPGGRIPSLVELIQNAAIFNPDFIEICGGFNDIGRGVPIGTMDDDLFPTFTNGVIDLASVANATFSNSLRYVIRRAIILVPGAKIFGSTPHYFKNENNIPWSVQKQYIDMYLACMNRYGIPCIDMFNGSGFNDYTNQSFKEGVHSPGDLTIDGLHLSDLGALRQSERETPFLNS